MWCGKAVRNLCPGDCEPRGSPSSAGSIHSFIHSFIQQTRSAFLCIQGSVLNAGDS